MLLTDIEDLVVVLVERVFLPRHGHPGEDQAASAADDVHLPFMFPDLLDGLAGDAAVESDEINAVLRVQADHVEKILRRERGQIPLVVDHAVIDRNGADHRRTFAGQFPAERPGIAVAGEIHDGFRAQPDGAQDLFHLDVIVLAVPGHAKVHIDLRAQHTADPLGFQAGMALVRGDHGPAAGDKFHQLF